MIGLKVSITHRFHCNDPTRKELNSMAYKFSSIFNSLFYQMIFLSVTSFSTTVTPYLGPHWPLNDHYS